MTQNPPSLGKRFITIAQPYFFPAIKGGGLMTVLLMTMLLVFIFGTLFMLVGGITLTINHLSPSLIAKTASGLLTLMSKTFHSGIWMMVSLTLIVPAFVFSLSRKHLQTRRRAWGLLAMVLFLSLSVTGINVAFSYIGNYFTNALVNKDQSLSYLFIAVYFCGFLVGIPILAFYDYVQSYLGMHWRKWLTAEFMEKYFTNRNYYDIETKGQIDNPDQRIMEDIRTFTRTSLTFLLIILGSVMDLISFTGILWSKSVLLVMVVLGYSLVGTLMTVLIGRRLVRLNFNQLRFEADFRYSLVHVRDNAESIAFYQGEKQEASHITRRFRQVLGNFNLLIGWKRNLSFFTTAYSYLPVVLPYLVLFPKYFSGKIDYGDMAQANFAFIQVYGSLSLIVSQIEQITSFTAGVKRLSDFSEAISQDQPSMEGISSNHEDRFALNHMTLMTPNRMRTLISDLTVDLGNADDLLIVGQSGVGKSSLLRAIAGLWTQGNGSVTRPASADIFFLPQKPYMLLGTLRDQLLYPRTDAPISDAGLKAALSTVRLENLPERMGGFDVELDWADVLSLGEQQRLAFARLLVSKPRFAVLDEATSALDMENEAHLYRTLKDLGIHYISVGHRLSILEYHTLVLDLKGQDQWRLMPVFEYKSIIGKMD